MLSDDIGFLRLAKIALKLVGLLDLKPLTPVLSFDVHCLSTMCSYRIQCNVLIMNGEEDQRLGYEVLLGDKPEKHWRQLNEKKTSKGFVDTS